MRRFLCCFDAVGVSVFLLSFCFLFNKKGPFLFFFFKRRKAKLFLFTKTKKIVVKKQKELFIYIKKQKGPFLKAVLVLFLQRHGFVFSFYKKHF